MEIHKLDWKQNLRHLAPAAALAFVGTASVAAALLSPTNTSGTPVGVVVIGADDARVAGIIALCQPWHFGLHSWGVTIILVGLIGFNIAAHVPQPEKKEG